MQSSKAATILRVLRPLAAPSILLLALAYKLVFLLADVFPFNSDEAVVALMARHILQGERPIFFYGQAYMGSLDAWLVSLGFLIFGEHIWVVRAVQTALYLGVIYTTILIGRRVFGSEKIALIAGLLLAIPTVNVTLYTTVSLGGYGEALLLGNLMLLTGYAISDRLKEERPGKIIWLFGLWGLLAGVGLWANGLTLVYAAPSGLYLFWRLFSPKPTFGLKHMHELLLGALGGFMLGALPWWVFAVQQGLVGLLSELLGGAVAVENVSWPLRIGAHLVNLILLGSTVLFGLRPPWSVEWLVMPLLPVTLLFWCAVIWSISKFFKTRSENRGDGSVLLGVMLVLLAAFILTPFGIDPSGRYFLPMAIPLALFAAWMLSTQVKDRTASALLVIVILFYQGLGTWQMAVRPPYLTTQFYAPSVIDYTYDEELIAFLEETGETRGYSNYWVTYPLAFKSQERFIFTPALPYHADLRYTPRDDRYAPYQEMVAESERVAYINTRIPEVTTALRADFTRLSVTWQERAIGDYVVFYDLSRVVRPDELTIYAPVESAVLP